MGKGVRNEYRNQQHHINFHHQRNHLDFAEWRCLCFCNSIDKATGLILDLKVGNEVSADDIISVISDLRIVSSMIRNLTPEEEKGGVQ